MRRLRIAQYSTFGLRHYPTVRNSDLHEDRQREFTLCAPDSLVLSASNGDSSVVYEGRTAERLCAHEFSHGIFESAQHQSVKNI